MSDHKQNTGINKGDMEGGQEEKDRVVHEEDKYYVEQGQEEKYMHEEN